jgi:hypothetical protein
MVTTHENGQHVEQTDKGIWRKSISYLPHEHGIIIRTTDKTVTGIKDDSFEESDF